MNNNKEINIENNKNIINFENINIIEQEESKKLKIADDLKKKHPFTNEKNKSTKKKKSVQSKLQFTPKNSKNVDEKKQTVNKRKRKDEKTKPTMKYGKESFLKQIADYEKNVLMQSYESKFSIDGKGFLVCNSCHKIVSGKTFCWKDHCQGKKHQNNSKDVDSANNLEKFVLANLKIDKEKKVDKIILERMELIRSKMIAGNSILSIDKERPFLEHKGMNLTSATNLLAKETMYLYEVEQNLIMREVADLDVVVIADCKQKFGNEIVGVIGRFITGSKLVITHRLLDLNCYDQSVDNEKLSNGIIQAVLHKGVKAYRVIGMVMDRSSVNKKAINTTLKKFFEKCVFVQCFSHTAANTGKKIELKKSKTFLHYFRAMLRNIKFSSELARINREKKNFPPMLEECNENKFFAEFEQIENIDRMFDSIKELIEIWGKKKSPSKSLKKLIKYFNEDKIWKDDLEKKKGSDFLFFCRLEMKVIIDFGRILHHLCYSSEGDGLTCLKIIDKLEKIKLFIQKKELPLTTLFLTQQGFFFGTEKHNEFKNYCLELLGSSFSYFESHLGDNGLLKEEINFFNFCRILDPSKCRSLVSNGFDLSKYKELKFIQPEFEQLNIELSNYVKKCEENVLEEALANDEKILEWWSKRNDLKSWKKLAERCFLICTSSCSIERAYNLLDQRFGKEQNQSSKELITLQLQTSINERKYDSFL